MRPAFVALVAALAAACKREEELRAVADDAGVPDAFAPPIDAPLDAPEDVVDVTAHVSVAVDVFEEDPSGPLKWLPGDWTPRHLRKVGSFSAAPYLGEPMRERLPDGSTFDFTVTRRLSGATWSGTRWEHQTVTLNADVSKTRYPCRKDDPFAEVAARYRLVITCDASSVPPLPGTGAFATMPPPAHHRVADATAGG